MNFSTDEYPRSGRCSCGEINYSLLQEPLAVYACHCTDCQRSTGSAFSLWVLVSTASLKVTAGEPVQASFKMPVGSDAAGVSCGKCGTRLWRSGRQNPDLSMVRAGTLSYTTELRPSAHFWTRSAQRWLPLPKDAACFDTQPTNGWDEVIELAKAAKLAYAERATTREATTNIRGISHLTFVVRDLDRAKRFFCDGLGGREVYDSAGNNFSVSREKFFVVGGVWLAAMEGDPSPRTYRHVALQVEDTELPEYEARLRAMGVEIKPARPRVEGEGQSLYFYDFDDNLFELHTGTLEERLARYAR